MICLQGDRRENRFIIVYVDGIIAAPTKKEVGEIKQRLSSETFKSKELDKPTYIVSF